MLKLRDGLTADEVERFSREICGRLRTLPEYGAAKDVCVYSPVRNEADIGIIIGEARRDGKRLWLPKVCDGVMSFHAYDEGVRLEAGVFGILEPLSSEVLRPSVDTLVVMPGAAFSEKRDRIGYGGGYYDTFLAEFPQCMTAAVCYDFQVLSVLPSDEHDIKPDVIVTQSGVIG